MNTRQKGDYSELAVLAQLARMCRRAAIPYGNCQGFDLLVESTSGGWRTVQVKTAYRRGARGNRIYVDTIRGTSLNKKRGYADGSFDFIVAALPDESKFWVIRFDEMANRRCLTIDETRDAGWHMI